MWWCFRKQVRLHLEMSQILLRILGAMFHINPRWWFQTSCFFHPKLQEMIQFDVRICFIHGWQKKNTNTSTGMFGGFYLQRFCLQPNSRGLHNHWGWDELRVGWVYISRRSRPNGTYQLLCWVFSTVLQIWMWLLPSLHGGGLTWCRT